MAQDATTIANGAASVRLVAMAREKFGWTLTKTRLADECRLAGELLEYWDENTIQRAIGARFKLASMRWLAEFIPQMLAGRDTPKQRPAILDEPDPDVTPMPPEIREQMYKLIGRMGMP